MNFNGSASPWQKVETNFSADEKTECRSLLCDKHDKTCDEKVKNRVFLNDRDALKNLGAGDCVYLCGTVYTARDAAHKRLFTLLNNGNKLPFEQNGAVIYYVGPCFDNDGNISSAGPTTSSRMDAYAPAFYDSGVIATIGKGDRSEEVFKAIKRNKAVYFSAVGGSGALYSKAVANFQDVCYTDLGCEAVKKLIVTDFPAVVAIDSDGNSIYK